MSSIYEWEDEDGRVISDDIDAVIALICFLAPFLIIAYYMAD